MEQPAQITIIGAGLIGGSLGLALKAAGYTGRVVGYGRRPERLDNARQRGCVDDTTTDLAKAVQNSDLVVLATPLRAFPELLQQLAQHDQPGITFTDVGSTKQYVLAQARDLLPDPTRFVGSHPMAGSEQHGADHARADLFQAKPCIVTPEEQTEPNALNRVLWLWNLLGMHVTRMSPAEHDLKTARVSHLPHALAALMVEHAARLGGIDIASTGFRDATRIASGDPDVWLDILATNRQAMVDVIDTFAAELAQLRQDLAGSKEDRVLEMLRAGKDLRDAWIEKWRRNQHPDKTTNPNTGNTHDG